MALTREDAEKSLIKRTGAWMTQASLDGSTQDGTNEDLDDVMATVLMDMGYSIASFNGVADSDLLALDNPGIVEFLDRCELRLMETVQGNLIFTDISIGPRTENLSKLMDAVDKRVIALSSKVQKKYGVDLGTLSAGSIGLDFQTKATDD